MGDDSFLIRSEPQMAPEPDRGSKGRGRRLRRESCDRLPGRHGEKTLNGLGKLKFIQKCQYLIKYIKLASAGSVSALCLRKKLHKHEQEPTGRNKIEHREFLKEQGNREEGMALRWSAMRNNEH